MITFEKEAKERARDFTDNKEKQIAYECGFLDGADRMRGEMQKLKEDNADLKQSLDWANERESEDCKRIAELEEENEKLKKEIEISQRCWQEQKNISLDTNCKLHKAKGLLRELYSIVKVESSLFARKEHKNILTETLEFLQEE